MTTGKCKHGKFDLTDGCPQCIEERRGAGIPPGQDEMEDGLNAEGFTLGNRQGSATYSDPEKAVQYAGEKRRETETAVVLRPGEDAEVHAHYLEAIKALKYAKDRVIQSPEDNKAATNDLTLIAGLKKAMEKKRKEYLAPLRDQADAIRETYSTLMDPVLEADKITRDKMLAYRAEQDRIRQEQEDINRKRLEAAEAEKRLKGEVTEPVQLIDVAPQAPKATRTEMGTAAQRMVKKWELIDIAQVPDEYKILDSARITKVVKASIPSIAGIRIYEEAILTVKPR